MSKKKLKTLKVPTLHVKALTKKAKRIAKNLKAKMVRADKRATKLSIEEAIIAQLLGLKTRLDSIETFLGAGGSRGDKGERGEQGAPGKRGAGFFESLFW